MRRLPTLALIIALAPSMAALTFGGGILGERYDLFASQFPEHRLLRDAQEKTESCMTFAEEGWQGIACFRGGVCVALFLLPETGATHSEEEMIARLDELHPGLTWTKNGKYECQDGICHGALFPEGRGAYLIATDAQKQAKSRKSLSKDLFSQTMATALLRLGDPVDYNDGVLVWETAQMRIGVPLSSSAMEYLAWEPTRQKKLRDKKALRMTKDLVSVDFIAPSHAYRTEGSGALIGYGKEYLYCLIRNADSPYMYTVCKSSLRYDDLREMADALIFPLPKESRSAERDHGGSASDGKAQAPVGGSGTPGSAPAPSPAPAPPAGETAATEPSGGAPPAAKPAGQTPVVPARAPLRHEDVLKSFIESLEQE